MRQRKFVAAAKRAKRLTAVILTAIGLLLLFGIKERVVGHIDDDDVEDQLDHLALDVHHKVCTTREEGSPVTNLWICMHAWDDNTSLRRAIASVLNQKSFDVEHRIQIQYHLIIYVDRCGEQPDDWIHATCSGSNSPLCTILTDPEPERCPSRGSAAAKWELISYIRQKIKPTEYFTFLDGDDQYVRNSTLLDVYVSTLFEKRPFFAWGQISGNFSDQCKDISAEDRAAVLKGNVSVREITWSFCHPRFFRGVLAQKFDEKDFRREDGTWLQKATDRPLVYHAVELGGLDSASFIFENGPHVNYSFTKHNGLRRFSQGIISADKKYVIGQPGRLRELEYIHAFVAVFARNNTAVFLDHLAESASNLPPNTVFWVHFANNSPERQLELEKLAKQKTKDRLKVTVTNIGHNAGGFARFIVLRNALLTQVVDFSIFIDDDQYVESNTLAALWMQRSPGAMVSWYGKSWNKVNANYWKPHLVVRDKSPYPREWHYSGTGLSVVDTLIFSDERVFKIPYRFFFVEDVWLSYILKVNGWKRMRAFVNVTIDGDLSNTGQWTSLMVTKQRFLQSIQKCPVPLVSKFDADDATQEGFRHKIHMIEMSRRKRIAAERNKTPLKYGGNEIDGFPFEI